MIFKVLSDAQNCLRPESAPLNGLASWQVTIRFIVLFFVVVFCCIDRSYMFTVRRFKLISRKGNFFVWHRNCIQFLYGISTPRKKGATVKKTIFLKYCCCLIFALPLFTFLGTLLRCSFIYTESSC